LAAICRKRASLHCGPEAAWCLPPWAGFLWETPTFRRCLRANQSLQGFSLLPLLDRETLASDLVSLFGLAEKGELKVLKGGVFPLIAAAAAHRAIENRETAGKVVLLP
jgi:NADPH2:quinone reductase